MASPSSDFDTLSLEEQELIKIFRGANKTAIEAHTKSAPAPQWARTSNSELQGPRMGSAEESSTTLFDMGKLYIPRKHQPWFGRLMTEAQTVMSQNDNSHNWEHIQRVVTIALRIYKSEMESNPSNGFDATTLFAAMIVHEVGDGKYLQEGETGEQKTNNLLKKSEVPSELLEPLWLIADGVSYTAEMANPEAVRRLIKKHPELAVVQDADRIDALGVVGIGRCFAFGGASTKRKHRSFHMGAQLIWERFYNYLPLMKTAEGKKMALARWAEMQYF